MKRVILFFILIFLLALVALPLLAQDGEVTQEAPAVICPIGIPVPPENCVEAPLVESPANEIITVTDDVSLDLQAKLLMFATIVITAIWHLVYIPVAAPFVELLTSLSKRLPFLSNVSSPTLGFTFTVAAWLGFILMMIFGYGERYDDAIKAITMLASTIFAVPVTQAAAQGIHTYAQKKSVPILGYSRTPNIGKQFGDAVEKAIDDMVNKMVNVPVNSSQGEKTLSPIAEAAGSDYAHRDN